jgi:hypothetical protein
MFRSGGRIALALVTAPLALLLAACNTTGTIEVRSPTELAIDLTLTDYPRGSCTDVGSSDTELAVERGVDSRGERFCRLRGTVKAESVYGVRIQPLGDYYIVSLDLGENTTDPGVVDITLTLPGPVVASSSGTISGNSVRLTGREALHEDFELVARARPETSWVPIAGVAGLAVGVAGTLLVLRWRRRTALVPTPDTQSDPDGSTGPDELAEPTETDVDAVGADVRPEERPRPAADPTFWSRPPVTESAEPAAPDEPPDRRRPADHSIWGPPAEE